MFVRVRRGGLPVLAVLAVASFLSNSILNPWPSFGATSSFNLSVAPDPRIVIAGADVWVRPQPDRSIEDLAAMPNPSPGMPDGMSFLALGVKVGTKGPVVVLTNAATVSYLLAAMGVKLHPRDIVRPTVETTLSWGAVIRVVRVRETVVTVTEALPFQTLTQYSKDLAADQIVVVQPGVGGSARRTYRIVYRNGLEAGRILLAEQVLSSPADQIVERGLPEPAGHGSETGQGSWYSRTGMCAANLTLPKGTWVTVTNLDNGKSVGVIIDDRGPYGVPGRIIDLCQTAFAQIAPLGQGVARVTISW